MSEVATIGLDIAKNVFHAHGVDASGSPLFSRKSHQVARVLRQTDPLPNGVGGLRPCARELTLQGNQVRLIPPAYVKPLVKRNKNDAVDVEGICEAVQRPNMRFVVIKSEEQQASALVFRTRDLVVRQRPQLINAIRGLLTVAHSCIE